MTTGDRLADDIIGTLITLAVLGVVLVVWQWVEHKRRGR